jgi:hypothetical protein
MLNLVAGFAEDAGALVAVVGWDDPPPQPARIAAAPTTLAPARALFRKRSIDVVTQPGTERIGLGRPVRNGQ